MSLYFEKRPFLKEILVTGILFVSMVSCNWQKKESELEPGETIRVQIPVFKNNKYSLEIIELSTIQSLTNFNGMAAQFLMRVKPNSRGQLVGSTPHFRYIRDDQGVIIPIDDESLQLITTYAHYEFLKKLDLLAGLKDVVKYPRTVVMATPLKSTEGYIENNAVYSSKYDSLLVAPYSSNSLPLMANAGVIGHEHFHSLFHNLVIKVLGDKYPKITEASKDATLHPSVIEEDLDKTWTAKNKDQTKNLSDRDLYHLALLRGVNEGLADLWGWIYSGDNNFVGRSLPQQKLVRDLAIAPTGVDGNFMSKSVLWEQVKLGASLPTLEAYSYIHGTQLARALRNHIILDASAKGESETELRTKFTIVIQEALPELQRTFANLKSDELMTLSQVAALIIQKNETMSSRACNYMTKLLVKDESPLQIMVNRCREIESRENGSPHP